MAEANRYCGNCGHGLAQDDNFCPGCGNPVHRTAQVPTPEANVPVTPLSDTQQTGGGARAGKFALGCLGIFVILIVSITLALAIGEGGGGGVDQGEGETPAANTQPTEESESLADVSIETFTRENYNELVSDPDAHVGAKVDITGQLLEAPEVDGGRIGFQMWADPENIDWNTVVFAEDTNVDLQTDDYAHVVGTVQGAVEGENAFGGTVTAVEVEATEVQEVSGAEAVDPTQETVEVGQTLTDQGFSVTLEKIEFGEQTTRVYVSAYNGTNTLAYFDDYSARIIQGSQQLDQEYPIDYDVKEIQTELSPGVQTDGVVTFGKADASQPLEVHFEWSSDDFDITANPLIFQVAP